ncbi:MAG: response regulator transcription factor [Saccharofermentanales bacterium]
MRLLVVEDDKNTSGNICESVKHLFTVDQAFDGAEGLQFIMNNEYDVIVLDIMMPKVDGLKLLSEIRCRGITTPILLLTALDQVSDKVRGLQVGADDYLAKPFDIFELQARLEALVRRTTSGGYAGVKLTFLDLSINISTRSARIGDSKLNLPGKQYDLLEYLVRNKNVLVHKERIFQRIWGFYSSTDLNVIDVYISQLRKELKKYDYDRYLKTLHGLGYILTDDADLYG